MSNRDEQRILLLRGLDRIALLQRLDDFCDDGSNILYPILQKICRDAAAEIRTEHTDASRYRWLRDKCRAEHDADIAAGIGWRSHANGSLDAWIDAVRKA